MSAPKIHPMIGAAALSAPTVPVGTTYTVPGTSCVIKMMKNDAAAAVHPAMGAPSSKTRSSLATGTHTTDISRSNVLCPETGLVLNSGVDATNLYHWSLMEGDLEELNAKFGTSIKALSDGSLTAFGAMKHSADSLWTLGSFGTGNVKGVAQAADVSNQAAKVMMGARG